MLEQLELLIRLSVIDGELQDLHLERESLPESIKELEREKELLLSAVTSREERLEELAKERRQLEAALEDLNVKLADLESKRLQIKTNAEYAALSLEIEHARTQISESEDGVLRSFEAGEQLTSELNAATQQAETGRQRLDERIAELSGELKKLDDAIAVKNDERLRVAMLVDKPTLTHYERILESKGDSAVACVTDGACSGCRMRLPPQMVIEVKRSDRMIECQSCGRILCWKPEEAGG